MNLTKVINMRVACLFVTTIGIAAITSGCAFGDRHLTLNPAYANDLPSKKVTTSPVHVESPQDVRNNEQPANFVGYVRNGYGMHTADVFADKNADEWVKKCITQNLKRAGFKVATEKVSGKGLCISTKIHTIECEAYLSMDATIKIEVKLKKSGQEFFSRTFTGKASQTNWMASSSEYQEALTNAMQQCLDKMMPVLIKELEKNSKRYASKVNK